MVVIYDVNGFIAGMHSIVAKKFVSGPFNFAGSKWYRSDNVLGEDVYLTTAYFVDPASICQGGIYIYVSCLFATVALQLHTDYCK